MATAQTDCVLISGCSCGGKSTLIDALAARGFATVPEPGRRIIAAERAAGGTALPWVDPLAFARRAVEMARADLDAAQALRGPVFFDRGLIDAAVALEHAGGAPLQDTLGPLRPYENPVLLAPPWPDIYLQDADRQHGLAAAAKEYTRLRSAFDTLGYRIDLLPLCGVEDRVHHVLARLGLDDTR